MSLTLIMIQVVSGVILRFHYEPNVAGAYNSILFIRDGTIFGQLVRNVHPWSGVFLIVVDFLHMLRVFLSAAFLSPRRWNWVIGVGLFFLVVFENFTGYLLPWDQLSYWAVTISASMAEYIPFAGEWIASILRGGDSVGEATLQNFFVFHTALLPGFLTVLLVWHLWKVRKCGGVALHRNISIEDRKLVETDPFLLNKEYYAGLAVVAFVLLFGLIVDAPMQERANPAFSPNPAKTSWYFQGIQ